MVKKPLPTAYPPTLMNPQSTSVPATNQTSSAFIGASWVALLLGIVAFNVGLWNATMALNEKGYYFTVLMYGLFAAISVQKSVRDRLEGIPVTNLYYGISWVSVLLTVLLLTVGLWNATLTLSEKGFYAMSFVLSLFAAIAVQKNTRDQLQNGQPEQRPRPSSPEPCCDWEPRSSHRRCSKRKKPGNTSRKRRLAAVLAL